VVRFRSPHQGRFHQLYANGRLVAWTDSPDERAFVLAASHADRQCTVAAVAETDRATDLAGELGLERPDWVVERCLTRTPAWPRDAQLELHGDGGSGTFLADPLTRADAWPAWVPRWAWGEDRFARGAFGWDGSAAPGLGEGAFGAGLFGFDERTVTLRAPLVAPGSHQVKIRLLTDDGAVADGPIETVSVDPPPAPPGHISLEDYDPATGRATLNIQGATS
jgi:hypothetical protein